MNPSTLPSTWQEALENHPVSHVRAFEKQLRAGVLRDREKLRGLVGSNYRDLLSTAEQIVNLHEKSRTAESSISALSQACQPPATNHQQEAPSAKARTASLIKFLDSLLRCTSKAIKERSVGLASKTLIIARLLLKHLEQENAPMSTLKWLQKRLKAVRQHLLHAIDAVCASPLGPLSTLIHAIVAYCVTTSSPVPDAIKHFQTLRGRKIAQTNVANADQAHRSRQVRQKMHYLIASIAATKALFGRRVSDLLQDVQKQPILEDAELAKLETLQLEATRALLPEDILAFTPYLKRTTPSASEARRLIQAWVDDIIKKLGGDVEETIASLGLRGALKTRNELFGILLPHAFTLQIGEHNVALLQDVFNQRIKEYVRQQIQGLGDLCGVLRKQQNLPAVELFWSTDVVKSMSSKSTSTATKAIQLRHLGADKDLEGICRQLRKWLSKVRLIREELEQQRGIRWQDKIEEYDDEDEDSVRTMISGLTKDDPAAYLTTLDTVSLEALENLTRSIEVLTSQVSTPEKSINARSKVTASLRTIREMRSMLMTLSVSRPLETLRTCTARLEAALAHSTASELFELIENKQPSSSATFVADDMPSPLTISVLQQLCNIMLKIGGLDLWTRSAVQKLQGEVRQRLSDEEQSSKYMCSELDRHYLHIALDNGQIEAGDVADASYRKAAAYWNRTKGLFGMLDV